MNVAIIGAGALGGAVCRVLAARGDRVTVVSRRPVSLPALWVHGDAVSGEGLRRAVAGCDTVIYAAAGKSRREGLQVARFGARNAAVAAEGAGARLVVLGPAGSGASAHHALLKAYHEGTARCRLEGLEVRVARLPVLFGNGDHLLSPWLTRAVAGEPVRWPRVRPPLRPLWLGDAARLVLAAVAPEEEWPGDVEVKGPREWQMAALVHRTCAAVGVRPAALPRVGGSARWDHLGDQLNTRDDWNWLELGQRMDVEAWLDRVGADGSGPGVERVLNSR